MGDEQLLRVRVSSTKIAFLWMVWFCWSRGFRGTLLVVDAIG